MNETEKQIVAWLRDGAANYKQMSGVQAYGLADRLSWQQQGKALEAAAKAILRGEHRNQEAP